MATLARARSGASVRSRMVHEFSSDAVGLIDSATYGLQSNSDWSYPERPGGLAPWPLVLGACTTREAHIAMVFRRTSGWMLHIYTIQYRTYCFSFTLAEAQATDIAMSDVLLRPIPPASSENVSSSHETDVGRVRRYLWRL